MCHLDRRDVLGATDLEATLELGLGHAAVARLVPRAHQGAHLV